MARPTQARYAWAPYPEWSAVNGDGLPAAPFRTAAWEPVRVACIGDSITAGYGLDAPARESYPARLQSLPGAGFEVRGFGRAGTCVVDSTFRSGWHRAFGRSHEHADALLFQPDVVVSNLGINDVCEWEGTRAEFEPDYAALLAEYRGLASEPEVPVWSPLAPLFPGHAFHASPCLAQIDRSIARVARKSRSTAIDVREPLAAHPAWFPDNIHPDTRGTDAIARVVHAALLEQRRRWTRGPRLRARALRGR